MSISINNSVANINGTPAAISGVFANRPASANQAEGTLYFSTDTLNIYQVVSGAWVNYAGGGGGGTSTGVNGLNGTTDIGLGGTLINDTVINVENWNFSLCNSLSQSIIFCNGSVIDLKASNTTELYLTTNNIITGNSGEYKGLSLDFNSVEYSIGDFNNSNNGTCLKILDGSTLIGTFFQSGNKGLAIDGGNKHYYLGDLLNYDNGTTFFVNDDLKQISTYSNSGIKGLMLDFNTDVYRFGNYGGYAYLECDNNAGRNTLISQTDFLISSGSVGICGNINASGQTEIGDFGGVGNSSVWGVNDNEQYLIASTNLLVNKSGSVSGQHLKINVGGTDYVIELKLPGA